MMTVSFMVALFVLCGYTQSCDLTKMNDFAKIDHFAQVLNHAIAEV